MEQDVKDKSKVKNIRRTLENNRNTFAIVI
jgi:hypothetical protein